jgi:hypothetical protein
MRVWSASLLWIMFTSPGETGLEDFVSGVLKHIDLREAYVEFVIFRNLRMAMTIDILPCLGGLET